MTDVLIKILIQFLSTGTGPVTISTTEIRLRRVAMVTLPLIVVKTRRRTLRFDFMLTVTGLVRGWCWSCRRGERQRETGETNHPAGSGGRPARELTLSPHYLGPTRLQLQSVMKTTITTPAEQTLLYQHFEAPANLKRIILNECYHCNWHSKQGPVEVATRVYNQERPNML